MLYVCACVLYILMYCKYISFFGLRITCPKQVTRQEFYLDLTEMT